MSHPTLSPMRLAVNILATLPLLSLLWPLYCLLFCASSLQVGHTLQPEVLQCRLLQLAQSLRGQGLQSNLVLITSLRGQIFPKRHPVNMSLGSTFMLLSIGTRARTGMGGACMSGAHGRSKRPCVAPMGAQTRSLSDTHGC